VTIPLDARTISEELILGLVWAVVRAARRRREAAARKV